MLREHYGDVAYIWRGIDLEWREVIVALNCRDLERKLGEHCLTGQPSAPLCLEREKIDSFTIQALTKNRIAEDSWARTGIFGFTQSQDKSYLVMGVRGGTSGVGKVALFYVHY